MKIKKNPAVDLNRWSTTFFLLGLCIMLFISWVAIEWKSYESTETAQDFQIVEEELEMDIPITNQVTPPPPPPPKVVAQVINVVEDTEEVEETIFESTETSQNQEIADVVAVESIEEVEEEVIEDVPFAVIEAVPIYPGCETKATNQERKDCMALKVNQFVQKHFDTEFAAELGLEGRQRISVQFKIDHNGNVINVRARAPHPRLEKEAIKVVSSLPKFTPGKQRGKAVGVLYALPILFSVESE